MRPTPPGPRSRSQLRAWDYCSELAGAAEAAAAGSTRTSRRTSPIMAGACDDENRLVAFGGQSAISYLATPIRRMNQAATGAGGVTNWRRPQHHHHHQQYQQPGECFKNNNINQTRYWQESCCRLALARWFFWSLVAMGGRWALDNGCGSGGLCVGECGRAS